MNKKKDRVMRTPFPGFPGAYILNSFAKEDSTSVFSPFIARPNVSFFYDSGKYGVEWGPPYGPITRFERANKDDEDAQEGYFYDYDFGTGNWNQSAVDSSKLPQRAIDGDFAEIFRILRSFVEEK